MDEGKKNKEPKLITLISFIFFNIIGIMAGLLIGAEMGWITLGGK